MSELVASIGKSIFVQILGPFFRPESQGLVRMFETEYQKDYRHAIKSGAIVDDQYVQNFLKSTRFHH